MQTERLFFLDVMKGIAILGVVFFHANLFKYGYLGVDVFFVIAGYLTTKSIVKQYKNGSFCYFKFLKNRLIRLWPLLLIVCVVSLGLGYFSMLPTNYKNTAETTIGSSLFLNNFVQYITAGDYWDASNEYKPLMHTWYIAVVFQFYMLYPLFFMVAHQFSKHGKLVMICILCTLGIGSLILYISPTFTTAFRFYLLPSRFFEFIAGGLLVLIPSIESNKHKIKIWCTLFLIILLMFFNIDFDAEQYRLLLIVVLTTLVLWTTIVQKASISKSKILARLGMASYSIYLWHQVIIAFYRNIFNDCLNVWEYILVIGISLLVGITSYYVIEQPISKKSVSKNKFNIYILSICCVTILPLTFYSFIVYKHEGVVKDIPELETFFDKPETWACLVYNDKVHNYDIDFPNNDKKNVLVVGDSYARDWYNILKESSYADSLNLSYHKTLDHVLDQRIEKADYIFLANHGDFIGYDSYIPRMLRKNFYRIGDKRYFSSPCLIYNKRFYNDSYYTQKIDLPNDIAERNRLEQQIFKERFINMMNVLKNKDGKYSIFTPENKIISHDGLHLTKAGAKFYANKLDIASYFMQK